MNAMKMKKEVPMGRYICFLGVFILLLCGLTFLLSSCDKELSEINSSGGLVRVTVSLGDDIYGEASVIRRYEDRQIVPEAVIVPVEGDLYVYATLEADPVPSTRAAIQLVENTTVHVVVYNAGTSTVVTSADYTIDNTFKPVSGTNIQINEGTYDFVAYSYNNTTQTAWDDVTQSSIDPSTDLLWGKSLNQVISATNKNVSILMNHLFSRVSVRVSTAMLGLKPRITSVGTATVGGGYQSSLTVVNGNLTSGTSATQSISNWSVLSGGAADSACVSDSRIVYPVGTAPVTIGLDAVTIDGLGNYTNLTANFNKTLLKGVSYTLRMDFKRLIFAGSNVYWNGSMLTFDDHTTTANMMQQGVYFKWGSLVGISPSGAMADSTTLYIPKSGAWVVGSNNSTFGGTGTGNKTENSPSAGSPGGTTSTAWGRIPYYRYVVSWAEDDDDRNHLAYLSLDTLNANQNDFYRGDICKYIGTHGGPAGYRLPTSFELTSFTGYVGGTWADNVTANTQWTQYTGSTWKDISSSQQTSMNGSYGPMVSGVTHASGKHLPASGYRYYNTGALTSVGAIGYYWSSSIEISSYSYYLYCGSTALFPGNASNRACGFSVRCVKN